VVGAGRLGLKTTATAAAHDVGRGAEADEVPEQLNSLCRAGRVGVIDPKRLEVFGVQLRHLGIDALRIKRQRDRGPCDARPTWAVLPLLDESRSAALAVVAKVLLVQDLVDQVLVGFEDEHLDDQTALHAVDVGPPDLHRRAVAVEALAHEHRNTFLAGEHVDQLELDAPVAVAVAHRLDVADRGIPPPSIAGERRAPRDVDDDVLGEEPKAVSQSPRLAAAR
jgi:hypothetical protein